MFDKFKEECAVIGVTGHEEASNYCYLGLYAMQHRGQEGAGIVTHDGKALYAYRDTGLVADIFDEKVLASLPGTLAVGHARYATFGGKNWQNLQPFVANVGSSPVSIAHNGNLVNAGELRQELESDGAIFTTTSDTEVFLHLMARTKGKAQMADRIEEAVRRAKGAFSLVIMGKDSLFAVRDPHGVRPLSVAQFGKGYVVASETCAFDLVGAQFIRDVKPGELLEITSDGQLKSRDLNGNTEKAFCVFEYVYFSRPDSVIEGRNVYQVRKRLGAELAREQPAEADVVIPVPDSGVPAAMGYAQEVGLPMEFGLIRNHYVGRTFIEPKQSIRDFGVKVKLNPSADVLKGRRVIVVDDSIVRGTTSKKIVKMLKDSGAKEVHFRVSSPPTTGPCHYGIDTPSEGELIANEKSVKEIESFLEADSLGYLSSEGMYRAVTGKQQDFCDACFSGKYRLGKIGKRNGGLPVYNFPELSARARK